MTSSPEYDVAIIGAGPGGYVAAIRATQLGLATLLIERESVGGLCLNWGCIPSKALLQGADIINLFKLAPQFGISYSNLLLDISVAVDRSREVVAHVVGGVETLLRQNGVTLLRGTATVTGAHSLCVSPTSENIQARNIIVATGAKTRSLPNVPIDGMRVLTSREALDLRKLPASIVVVGGGPIGVEFAYLYRSYGATVTIVEALPHLLPNEDEDVSRLLERSFQAQGIEVRLNTRAEHVSVKENRVDLRLTEAGNAEDFSAEYALLGVGFEPNTTALGLAAAGVELDGGWVKTDGYCQTNIPSVWAIGDITGRMLLAHVASHQGVVAIEKIAGLEPQPIDYDRMPRAVYCQPQVASLGLSEKDATERGINVRTGRFPFRANGKAAALGETDGFVKLVVDEETGQVIGYHMVGHNVTELLGEATLGMTLETTIEELGHAVHAHPTLAEAVREAALAVTGEAIHFYSKRGT